jgi:hypothetical protein
MVARFVVATLAAGPHEPEASMSEDVSGFRVQVRTGAAPVKPPRSEPNHVEELLREWFPDATFHELEQRAALVRWAVAQDGDGLCGECFW